MLAFFLLLVIVAIVLGIVGVVAKGLLYLLFIGIVVFLGALLLDRTPLRGARPLRRVLRPRRGLAQLPARGSDREPALRPVARRPAAAAPGAARGAAAPPTPRWPHS